MKYILAYVHIDASIFVLLVPGFWQWRQGAEGCEQIKYVPLCWLHPNWNQRVKGQCINLLNCPSPVVLTPHLLHTHTHTRLQSHTHSHPHAYTHTSHVCLCIIDEQSIHPSLIPQTKPWNIQMELCWRPSKSWLLTFWMGKQCVPCHPTPTPPPFLARSLPSQCARASIHAGLNKDQEYNLVWSTALEAIFCFFLGSCLRNCQPRIFWPQSKFCHTWVWPSKFDYSLCFRHCRWPASAIVQHRSH